jgi:hypothetical protein
MLTLILFLGALLMMRWAWNMGFDSPSWWDGSDDDWSDEINRL